MTAAKPATYAEALSALQAMLPDVRKLKTAKIRSERGQYEYDYADLANISAALLPKLAEVGLSFTARPTLTAPGEQGQREFVLAYSLRHISGDGECGEYPLPDPQRFSAQAVGSAITYARRYSLCAITGLAPDIDDDGQAASGKITPAAKGQQENAGNGQRQKPEKGQDDGPKSEAALALAKEAVKIASTPGTTVADLQEKVRGKAQAEHLLGVMVPDMFSGGKDRQMQLGVLLNRAKRYIENGGPGAEHGGQ